MRPELPGAPPRIFDMPMYLADHYDGWSSREVIDFFVFYAKTVFERYKGKVRYWMTFNEINVLSGWCQIGVHDNCPQNLYQAHHRFRRDRRDEKKVWLCLCGAVR